MIGFHASHEQFPPALLLQLSRHALQVGFDGLMCSDHFHPWTPAQGHAGHAWTWAGAAAAGLESTLGMVTCPMIRQHPTQVAQAAATVDQFAPGRFWMAVGTGEALNERVVGAGWGAKDARRAALEEAVQVMRALWAGAKVEHDGHFQVRGARLYTRPALPIPVIGAALTPETARWLAGWADGLITVSQPIDALREVVQAFEDGGGRGKPMYLQVKLSYARSEQAALDGAMTQWRANALPPDVVADLDQPEAFEARAHEVDEADLRRQVCVSADPDQHVQWLRTFQSLGFQRLYLHNVNVEQQRFIDDFGARVLPALRGQGGSGAAALV